ncbi:hypothetical protein CPB83DRAFT_98969 [Crepidotus variabilis]|uniref:Uncharacterized protein n=1 Tax=Crepidotus variabilis TaxID=179855 RepID=A0A9P6ELJ5_9AGAR|nr:hypothetical protein CPB83DRAFT_98969 [Crepidotus variabilis]
MMLSITVSTQRSRFRNNTFRISQPTIPVLYDVIRRTKSSITFRLIVISASLQVLPILLRRGTPNLPRHRVGSASIDGRKRRSYCLNQTTAMPSILPNQSILDTMPYEMHIKAEKQEVGNILTGQDGTATDTRAVSYLNRDPFPLNDMFNFPSECFLGGGEGHIEDNQLSDWSFFVGI